MKRYDEKIDRAEIRITVTLRGKQENAFVCEALHQSSQSQIIQSPSLSF